MRRASFLGVVVLMLAGISWGEQFGFTAITANSPDRNLIAAQLLVDVTTAPGGVNFTFTNTGTIGSSITDVYFDDGSLLAIAQITSSAGVLFGTPATPGNLPGGGSVTPPFVATEGFTADSGSPIVANGVNNSPVPGEWLTIFFTLQGTQTFADVIAELNSGALRIGLHVQGEPPLGSESDGYINNVTAVPEPASMLLLGSGLMGLAGIVRRRLHR